MSRLHIGAGLFAAIVLLASGEAHAAGVGVTAEMPSTDGVVGEPMLLTVTLSGERGEPQMPALPDFDVHPRGTSSQMRIVNGQVSSTTTYNFLLVPKRAGSFVIGAVTAELGGKTYSSQAFTVRISAAAGEQGGPAPAKGGDQELFLQATVSNDKPFVGEQVIYTLRFYRRVQLGGANLSLPEFEGLAQEELGEQREYEVVHQGKKYAVTEIKRALFVQSAGTLTIGPAKITADVVVQNRRRALDDFFSSPFFGGGQTQRRTVSSSALTLAARTLPPAPPGYSGLVGVVELSASLSRQSLKTGESATLTATVRADGNPQTVPEPLFPDLAAFKLYDERPTSSVEKGGNRLRGTKVFKKSIVAVSPGTFELEPVRLIYFDPTSQTYVTARSSSFSLNIEPSAAQEELRLTETRAPGAGKVSVQVLADDILPIAKDLTALSPALHERFGAPGWSLALSAPPLFYLGAFLARRRRERDAVDVLGKRRRQGRGLALRGLDALGAGGGAAEVSKVLRIFLGDMLGVEGAALTSVEVEDGLRRAGVEAELVASVRGFLDRCDAAQYGGASGAGSVEEARGLVDKLSRALRTP